MPHYKDKNGRLHFIEDDALKGMLPAGSVKVSDEEADALKPPPPKAADIRRGQISARLAAIDADSIRALRAKAAGNGKAADDTKLSALDAEADALRAELATL